MLEPWGAVCAAAVENSMMGLEVKQLSVPQQLWPRRNEIWDLNYLRTDSHSSAIHKANR